MSLVNDLGWGEDEAGFMVGGSWSLCCDGYGGLTWKPTWHTRMQVFTIVACNTKMMTYKLLVIFFQRSTIVDNIKEADLSVGERKCKWTNDNDEEKGGVNWERKRNNKIKISTNHLKINVSKHSELLSLDRKHC